MYPMLRLTLILLTLTLTPLALTLTRFAPTLTRLSFTAIFRARTLRINLAQLFVHHKADVNTFDQVQHDVRIFAIALCLGFTFS